MAKKTVKIACQGAATLGIGLLQPLQGDLKTLAKEDYERLRAEIIADGFSFPIAVWERPEDAMIYIIDGHQRLATLQKMQKDGWSIPELPVVFVHADTIDKAKHKLLAAASQYGKVNEDGLLAFLKDVSFTAEDLVASFRFPEIDLNAFATKYLTKPDELEIGLPDAGSKVVGAGYETPETPVNDHKPSNPKVSDTAQVRMVQLFFNGENHPEFLQKIQTLQQKLDCENMTDTVLAVVREAFDNL